MVETGMGEISSLRESGWRVAVWAAVIICHLGFLMLFLQPSSDVANPSLLATDDARALQLRFLLPLLSPKVSPARVPAARNPRPSLMSSPKPMTVSTIQHAADAPALPPETHATPVQPAPSLSHAEDRTNGDGGFQEQLREAQHSHAVHGVPGSDRVIVPGIRLVDPMKQGIGNVMRNAQRLFGIKSRHCIDVEAWRNLTTRELLARHISPDDVDRDDQKYGCNSPMGLHF